MKKIALLVSFILLITSCGDDLVFNNPSFRGVKDGVIWQAGSYRADIDAFGFITITAIKDLETVKLTASGTNSGATYNVGNTASVARYINELDQTYTTNNIPDPSIQLYPSEGKIVISEFNIVEKTVSGTFYFHAFDSSGLNSVVFNQGFFYNIPILSIAPPDNGQQALACQAAQATTATTLLNLNAVDPNGDQYPQYCNAYKVALQVEIQECGDDGTLQAIINSLGDCSN